MMVMNLVIDTAGVFIKNSFIGRAITMLQQARVFRAAKAAIDACAESYVVCKLLSRLLPKLPCVAAAVAAQKATDEILGAETTALDYAGAAVMGLERCSKPGPGKGGKGDEEGGEGGSCTPNSFDG